MAEEKEKKAAPNTEKLKALQAAMDKIEKSYGKGSIMKMGDDKIDEIAVVSTGSIALNAALGVGGYPRGRHPHKCRGHPAGKGAAAPRTHPQPPGRWK